MLQVLDDGHQNSRNITGMEDCMAKCKQGGQLVGRWDWGSRFETDGNQRKDYELTVRCTYFRRPVGNGL